MGTRLSQKETYPLKYLNNPSEKSEKINNLGA